MFKITGFADEIHENFDLQLKYFNQLKIDYIEIRGINGQNISELTENQVHEVKNKLDLHKIKVSSIASPIGKIFANAEFKEHFEMFKKIVEFSKILDTKYIRIFSFFIPENEDPSKYTDTVITRIKQLVEYAQKHNIILLHENEKDIYGDTPERLLKLIQEINSPNFKLIFDFANFVQCKVNTIDALERLKENVKYFHIKDATSDGTIVPAGDGDGEIKTILKEALNSGFSGFTSLEPHLVNFIGLQSLELNKNIEEFSKDGFNEFKLAHQKLENILQDLSTGGLNK